MFIRCQINLDKGLVSVGAVCNRTVLWCPVSCAVTNRTYALTRKYLNPTTAFYWPGPPPKPAPAGGPPAPGPLLLLLLCFEVTLPTTLSSAFNSAD